MNTKLFRVKEYMIDSNKLIFIFTAMGTKMWMYKTFIKKLNKKGYSCIIYDYDLDFLFHPSFKLWKEFFDTIIKDAQNRLKNYNNYSNFYSYGASMGTLIANKFARDTKEVTHVILNMTYGDVARNIWTYKGVRRVKEAYIKQGVSENDLRENIIYMDPIKTAKELINKKVLLQLSLHDHVLVYNQTKETKKAFEDAKLDLKYEESKFGGHYITGIKNLMNVKKIDQFYSNK